VRLTALQRFALHVACLTWHACVRQGCRPATLRSQHLREAVKRRLRERREMRRGQA